METHILDASKDSLGRLATKAATFLLGKDKPSFMRHKKAPVEVVIKNADHLILTGKKMNHKLYHRHSGYLGHLKTISAGKLKEKDSRLIVRYAVSGMLPKNKLRTALIKRLVVYKGDGPEK